MNSRDPAIEAMQRIISLAEDRREGCRRFQDMVQAAIEQFNAGSLARAATMFDLALGISSDDKLDPDVVAKVRRTAHESLSGERLRALAKEKDKHRLLQKVLGFFAEFSVKTLLDSLEGEEQRERRWLLLGLLESHADAAREMAFERLKELLAHTNVAIDWYFARNLIYILNSVPPGGDFSPQGGAGTGCSSPEIVAACAADQRGNQASRPDQVQRIRRTPDLHSRHAGASGIRTCHFQQGSKAEAVTPGSHRFHPGSLRNSSRIRQSGETWDKPSRKAGGCGGAARVFVRPGSF